MIFFLQAFFPFDHTRHTEAPTQGASKMRRDSINGEVMKLRDLLPLPPSTRYWHWSRQRWKLSILNTTSLPPESIPHQHLFLLSQQCVDGVCDRTRSWTDFLPLADWARPVPIVSAIIRFVLIILICIHLSYIQPRPDGLMMARCLRRTLGKHQSDHLLDNHQQFILITIWWWMPYLPIHNT